MNLQKIYFIFYRKKTSCHYEYNFRFQSLKRLIRVENKKKSNNEVPLNFGDLKLYFAHIKLKDVYFRLRFSLVNRLNTYSMLKIFIPERSIK